jgi:hypothetical protein
LTEQTPSPAASTPQPPFQTDKHAIVKVSAHVETLSKAAATALLSSINSPVNLADPQPPAGVCQSRVLSSMCAAALAGGWKIMGGCNSIRESCSPPEMASQSCLSRNSSAGAFVTSRVVAGCGRVGAAYEDKSDADDDDRYGRVHTNTIPRPTTPQQAKFVGCCVTTRPRTGAYGKQTCKRIRVGKRWQKGGATCNGGGTGGAGRRLLTHPIMNPYKQIRGCECFNIREYVHMDMFTRKQRRPPQHKLAPYPFSIGITSKVG